MQEGTLCIDNGDVEHDGSLRWEQLQTKAAPADCREDVIETLPCDGPEQMGLRPAPEQGDHLLPAHNPDPKSTSSEPTKTAR